MSSTASMAKSSFLVNRIMFARTDTPLFRVLLVRLSPRKRIWTSGLDAGRAEAGFLSTSLPRKRWHDYEVRPRNAGKDQLSNTVPGPDLDCVGSLRRIAGPRRNQAWSLVIGVDHADRVAEHQPPLVAEAGPRQHYPPPFALAHAEVHAA